jgi:hypothetical protein
VAQNNYTLAQSRLLELINAFPASSYNVKAPKMSSTSGSTFSSTKTSVAPTSRTSPRLGRRSRRSGLSFGTMLVVGVVSTVPLSGIPAGKRSTVSSNEMTDAEKIAAAASERRSVSPRPSGPGSSFDWAGPTPVAPEQQRSSTPFSLSRYGRYSGKRGSRAPTIIPRDAPITQADLIASAERIFARYLVPTAEKEIYLPPSLRIHTFLLSSEHPPDPNSPDYETEAAALAQVPDMFHAQKEYIFKAMEQDAFPRFLRSKAFGNLTPMSVLGAFDRWAARPLGGTLYCFRTYFLGHST